MSEVQDDITIGQFEALIESAYSLKAKKDEFEAQASAVGEELGRIQAQLLEYMEQFEKTSYRSKFGTIVRTEKFSVKIPKDPQAKERFFQWLDGKGIKDQILNINSQTLNSLYKNELEAAKAQGAQEFSIPGIEAPTLFASLTMRK